MKKNIELLSPVSTLDGLRAAANNGCDAVYFGGKSFNARQYASNFSDEELKNAIDYCHLRGIKVRITLNTLYKDSEINDVLEFAAKLCGYGADALIIQDLGIFSLIKKSLDIRLHASTQTTVHNTMGCEYMKSIGFDRVVAARELSLEEIKSMADTGIEIEAFVHGAICVCYSGRCLLSSFIGGRSGNRGRCAQPCRMAYSLMKGSEVIKSGYLISPKDMFTADIAGELIAADISAFKIEGRMKSPEYTALATKTYRKAIDTKSVSDDDKNRLLQVFNRGGGSESGYYKNWAGKNMISPSPKHSGLKIGEVTSYNYRTKKCTIKLYSPVVCGDGIEIWTQKFPHCGTSISENKDKNEIISVIIDGKISKGDYVYKSYDKKLNDELKALYIKDERHRKIELSIKIYADKPIICRFDFNDKHYEFKSDFMPQTPKGEPMEKEKIISSLSKTGNTPFIFDFKADIGEVFIPVSSLNAFRRSLAEDIEKIIISSYEKKAAFQSYTPPEKHFPFAQTAVSISKREQLDAVMKFSPDRIYVDFYEDMDYYIKSIKNTGNTEIFAALPSIIRTPYEDFEKRLSELEKTDIDGYLVRSHMNIKTNKRLIADYTFNVLNSACFEFLSQQFSGITLSPELSAAEAKALSYKGAEVIAYGRIPLMTTHQCPVGLYAADKKFGRYCRKRYHNDAYYLKDRKGELFPIITDCKSCTAQLLSPPVFNNADVFAKRLIFTDETNREIESIMNEYKSGKTISGAKAYYSKGVI